VTKALEATSDNVLAAYSGHEWESDGTEDIQPSFPILKIVQPTSSMEGASKHGGEFYRTDTGEFYPTVEVVPLIQRETRAYFEEGHDNPSCMSPDAKAPLPNQPLWAEGEQPTACADCPFSQWGEDNTPPPCKLSYVVLCDLDNEMVQLRIGGKSMKPWRNFVSKKIRPRKLPLCSHRVTLGTAEHSEPGRRWNEMVVQDATLLPPETASEYNAVLYGERFRFEQAVREVVDEGAEAPRANRNNGAFPDLPEDDLPFE
jgi:hypothetical protein